MKKSFKAAELTPTKLGMAEVFVISKRRAGAAEHRPGDLEMIVPIGPITRYLQAWRTAELAERYIADHLTPRERPPWHRGIGYPEYTVLALTVEQVREHLCVLGSHTMLFLMEWQQAMDGQPGHWVFRY